MTEPSAVAVKVDPNVQTVELFDGREKGIHVRVKDDPAVCH